jgi:hypothetical protein
MIDDIYILTTFILNQYITRLGHWVVLNIVLLLTFM